jgi:uncharacterized protein (TIGR01319 family)
MPLMKIDLLVAEIGSTTTVLTAFQTKDNNMSILAQSEYKTTIPEGDVTIGIEKALSILSEKLGENFHWNKFLATSSAAGGLTVTVHGLVYDMTVKAAQEASLGAGAIIKYVTAGKLRESQLTQIKKINPKLIILSGGVDYGEEEIVVENARLLASLPIKAPVIYAGNCAIQEEIKDIFDKQNKKIIITENVYPKVDQLNVEPARKIIQEVFSKHIINAPGMEKIYDIVDEEIIPTPAAVVHTTELLSTLYEDVMTIDIGGATTDIVSVTDGSTEIQKILVSPEPRTKRTVDGDLGIYINATHVIDLIGIDNIKNNFSNYNELLNNLSPFPNNDSEEKFCAFLAKYCLLTAIKRHAGKINYIYTPLGRQKIAQGKDLTAIKVMFGTGGILSRSKYRKHIMQSFLTYKFSEDLLIPPQDVKFAYDKNYIFANIGIIGKYYKDIALTLLKNNVEFI